ncbi:MAG: hypothetical protein ABSF10_14510 [Verrucomicrobiota bacterium]|jgi:hypothetical protein
MNSDDLKSIESQRQALLGQLTAAETALRAGLHNTRGFGDTARAHLERARAHIQEAYIAINEAKSVRTVQQLVDDLSRVQQVMDDVQRRKSQRI